jgi:hypothetical protein
MKTKKLTKKAIYKIYIQKLLHTAIAGVTLTKRAETI